VKKKKLRREQTARAQGADGSAWAPRAECLRCRRPAVVCYCAHVHPIRTRTRVVILQHPRERRNPIGTARMATISLVNSELHVGTALDDDPDVARALNDPEAPAVLLYPGPTAEPLASLDRGARYTLVAIDGTWAQARTVYRDTLSLHGLRRVRLDPPRPSEYRIRAQPRPECVSTIEALYFALRDLEGDAVDVEPLLAPFRAMVQMQIDSERLRRERNLPERVSRAIVDLLSPR
jgi:DTW domain-containing protein YfiP